MTTDKTNRKNNRINEKTVHKKQINWKKIISTVQKNKNEIYTLGKNKQVHSLQLIDSFLKSLRFLSLKKKKV